MQTEADKKEMLQIHFLYECEMLVVALEVVTSEFSKEMLNRKKESVALEIFLLHARSLLEFFYYPPTKPERPCAQHFLKEGIVWKDIVPLKTANIKKLEKQVNEDMSHLSYSRIAKQDEDRRWDILSLFKDLFKIIKVFLSGVKEDYLNDTLRKIITR